MTLKTKTKRWHKLGWRRKEHEKHWDNILEPLCDTISTTF